MLINCAVVQDSSLSAPSNLEPSGKVVQSRLSINRAILSSLSGWYFQYSDFNSRNLWFFLLSISSFWSRVFRALELENIRIQGHTLGLLASWERVAYSFPFVIPTLLPHRRYKLQPVSENAGQANHQLPYIQHLVMLGCVITGFYCNSERKCCWQKTLSCQPFPESAEQRPPGQPDPVTGQCKFSKTRTPHPI